MSKYTINDVSHIIPVEQTAITIEAVEKYLNEGVIPPYDPCLECEPSHIRKLISLIQIAERNGLLHPNREEKVTKKAKRAEVSYVAENVDGLEETPEETEAQD